MQPARPATALSIAGSDPSGGAGIQADLKTFADHGVYGMAALTALTAQSTAGVRGVHGVPPSFVVEQLQTLRADLPVDAIKLGMLATEEIIEAVGEALSDYEGPIVLDPVMVATSGARLLDPAAEAALGALARRRATLVTPNLPEAEVLLEGREPARYAAVTGVALLVKDGHGQGAMVEDRLYLPDGSLIVEAHPRIRTGNTHGTGCTLSSAIAARLARGEALEPAVRGGLRYVASTVYRSRFHELGEGAGPLLHGRLADG